MHRALRGLAIGLLALGAIVLGFRLLAPLLLDRVYYSGPPSDHYRDGRFFNPDGEQGDGGTRRFPMRTAARFAIGKDRARWPASVPIVPSKPPARVMGEAMRVTWIGHATMLVQTQGLNILTDPVWSERASPVSFLGPKRVREPGVRFADLPKIDIVLVSHNHYDHLDLDTLTRLWTRDRPLIVTGLGNDMLMRDRGITAVARDWGQRVPVRPGIDVVLERVHHWTSRWMIDRDRALWTGFTVTLPGGNLFFAGDTGPGDGSWPKQAAKDGPYRLALIPIGAFEPRAIMSGNHIGPVEAVDVFQALGARDALGIHWGTFQLSNEAIDAPPRLLAATLAARHIAPDRFRTTEAGEPWMVAAMTAK